MKALKRSIARVQRFVDREVTDPALDILGAHVLGLYVGRSTCLLLVAASAASAQMPLTAGLLVGYVVWDGYVHRHVLISLQDAMAREVLDELRTYTPSLVPA